jgi:hypothetical protein
MRAAELPPLSQHGTKLSVVSKYVTCFAEVPLQIASLVQQLHLGNNSLRTLGGAHLGADAEDPERSSERRAERPLGLHCSASSEPRGLSREGSAEGAAGGILCFSNVRVLSLSNNQLRYLEDLAPLAHLPCLATLVSLFLTHRCSPLGGVEHIDPC